MRRPQRQLRAALFLLAPLAVIGFVIAFLPFMTDRQDREKGAEKVPPGSDIAEEIGVRIDVQSLGDGAILDEVRTTVKVRYVNEEMIRSRFPSFASCGLVVTTGSQWSGARSTSSPVLGDRVGPPFYSENCLKDAVDRTFDEYTEHVLSATKTSQYMYPFDHLVFRVAVGTRIALLDSEKRSVLVFNESWQWADPEVRVSVPGWRIEETYLSEGRVVQVDLRRPLSIRLFTPLLLIFLLASILAIPLVESLGDSMQLAIASALFIWGAHESLVPKDSPFLLLLDLIFVTLEVMAIASMLLAVWFHLRSSSLEIEAPVQTSSSPRMSDSTLEGSLQARAEPTSPIAILFGPLLLLGLLWRVLRRRDPGGQI